MAKTPEEIAEDNARIRAAQTGPAGSASHEDTKSDARCAAASSALKFASEIGGLAFGASTQHMPAPMSAFRGKADSFCSG